MVKTMAGGVFLAVVAMGVLVACGPKPPQEVQVTLTDFGIESSLSAFEVGQPYRFVITNSGALDHEFMIIEPLMPGMEMSMEEMDEIALAVVEVYS